MGFLFCGHEVLQDPYKHIRDTLGTGHYLSRRGGGGGGAGANKGWVTIFYAEV